jgi:hypothetical protein
VLKNGPRENRQKIGKNRKEKKMVTWPVWAVQRSDYYFFYFVKIVSVLFFFLEKKSKTLKIRNNKHNS